MKFEIILGKIIPSASFEVEWTMFFIPLVSWPNDAFWVNLFYPISGITTFCCDLDPGSLERGKVIDASHAEYRVRSRTETCERLYISVMNVEPVRLRTLITKRTNAVTRFRSLLENPLNQWNCLFVVINRSITRSPSEK